MQSRIKEKMSEMAIIIADDDNVAIAKKDIEEGTTLKYNGKEIKTLEFIAKGQRFSITDIKEGELLNQYSYPFGISTGIKMGQLLNRHNVMPYHTKLDELKGTSFHVGEKRHKGVLCEDYKDRTFKGYIRRDGGTGTRNYYLIVPTSLCAGDVAFKLANELDNNESINAQYRNIDGIVSATHTEGCGCNDGEIVERLMLTLKNTINHPNVGGALIVDLGCEKTNIKIISNFLGDLSGYCKPIDFISIQGSGGTGKTLLNGKNVILNRLKEINSVTREEVPIRHLIIGTECGASDTFSGITANPVIGLAVDKVICAGGSAILSETPEMLGAETILLERMRSVEVAEKFIKGIGYYKELADKLNVSMEGNIAVGNREGGLLNLTLKSLGAILKGGNSEIVDFLSYAEQIKRPGLSIMNGPGNDIESMTGIAASGANLILFSTGLGTTEGNLIIPVIKITTRTEVYTKMSEDMDFDAGCLLNEDISLDELSNKLLDLVIKVASGKKTCSEVWKKRAFQIWTAGKLSL